MTNQQREPAGVVVVGVDGSAHGDAALAWAAGEARLRNSSLRIVHAWQYLPIAAEPLATLPAVSFDELAAAAGQVVDNARQRVGDALDPGVTVEIRVVEGPAGAALLDAAGDADLLVVGSRGRGGFAGLLLGSVSQQVTHHAHCPVVVLPKEFDAPRA